MAKLKNALERARKALSLNQSLLSRAQRRYKANRKRAFQAHNQQEKAQKQADARRAASDPSGAARYDKQAGRHGHVAYRNHVRAQFWLGRVKVLQQRVNDLDTSVEGYEKKLKANKAHVKDGKVVGGTARQKLRCAIHTAAKNCATGAQNNYYSESGLARAYLKTLAGYPYGHIWDCSTFADGSYIVCDLEAPSGPNTLTEGGYTGTEGEHGKRVTEAQAKTGDLALYGPFPHHHVEVVDDPKAKTTIGHGSPPIDAGVFDLFGDGDYEIRSYL